MNLKSFSKANTKNKTMITAGAFVMFCAALTFFVIVPSIADIKDLKQKIIHQKVELETKTAREKNLKNLNEKLEKIDPQLAKFDRAFIKKERDLEFITALEDIAQKNKTQQTINLSVAAEKDEKTYKKIPLELTISGNFLDLMNYLADIESSDYYININRLELNAASPAPALGARNLPKENAALSAGTVIMKITADTYWR